jgi:hypothetical protein
VFKSRAPRDLLNNCLTGCHETTAPFTYDKTIMWAVCGKMNNTGQCCVAAKRFIVVEELIKWAVVDLRVKINRPRALCFL